MVFSFGISIVLKTLSNNRYAPAQEVTQKNHRIELGRGSEWANRPFAIGARDRFWASGQNDSKEVLQNENRSWKSNLVSFHREYGCRFDGRLLCRKRSHRWRSVTRWSRSFPISSTTTLWRRPPSCWPTRGGFRRSHRDRCQGDPQRENRRRLQALRDPRRLQPAARLSGDDR